MEFTARFNNIEIDSRGEVILSLVANERQYVAENIDKLKKQKTLTVKIDKYREKRSLNANAYAWVLMQKLAEAVDSSKWDIYLEMLQRYSRKFVHNIVPENEVEECKKNWRVTVELGKVRVRGKIGIQMQCYFRSSQFNTEEMAVFINGLVSECEDLGIETLPPKEVSRLIQEWGQEDDSKR